MDVYAKIITKAVIINPRLKKALLIKRSPDDGDSWESAGGSLEEGETPEQGVIREVFEETGLNVSPEKILYVSLADYGKKLLFIVYLCKTEDENVTLSFEHTDYRWVGKAECRGLLCGGAAEDYIKHGVYDLEW